MASLGPYAITMLSGLLLGQMRIIYFYLFIWPVTQRKRSPPMHAPPLTLPIVHMRIAFLEASSNAIGGTVKYTLSINRGQQTLQCVSLASAPPPSPSSTKSGGT